jgi:hypothetical protein
MDSSFSASPPSPRDDAMMGGLGNGAASGQFIKWVGLGLASARYSSCGTFAMGVAVGFFIEPHFSRSRSSSLLFGGNRCASALRVVELSSHRLCSSRTLSSSRSLSSSHCCRCSPWYRKAQFGNGRLCDGVVHSD